MSFLAWGLRWGRRNLACPHCCGSPGPERSPLSCCFAILPDEATEEELPLAFFENLEDALEWGAQRYRGGSFRVRYVAVEEVPPPPPPDAS